MTVIICNRKAMAGDSLAVNYGSKSKAVKLHRVGEDIIGFCGEYQQGLLFVEWYKDRTQKKPDKSDMEGFSALVLSKNGITQYESALIPIPVFESFATIGSGMDVATGAYLAGKRIEDAVRITCKARNDCGLPVKVMRLK